MMEMLTCKECGATGQSGVKHWPGCQCIARGTEFLRYDPPQVVMGSDGIFRSILATGYDVTQRLSSCKS